MKIKSAFQAEIESVDSHEPELPDLQLVSIDIEKLTNEFIKEIHHEKDCPGYRNVANG